MAPAHATVRNTVVLPPPTARRAFGGGPAARVAFAGGVQLGLGREKDVGSPRPRPRESGHWR